MPSVTLEALIILALTMAFVLYAYTQIPLEQACTLNYNPLTQINDAVQAAYSQPYTQIAVPINATLTIKTYKNTIEYFGCKAPQPTMVDPESIVSSYTLNSVEYRVDFREGVLSTPCVLSIMYNPFNHTMLTQCSQIGITE